MFWEWLTLTAWRPLTAWWPLTALRTLTAWRTPTAWRPLQRRTVFWRIVPDLWPLSAISHGARVPGHISFPQGSPNETSVVTSEEVVGLPTVTSV